MDERTQNTFELCLKEWVENSILFRDLQKWIKGLREELAEIPGLEGEIKAIRLEINLRLQSLLLKRGFEADGITDLMNMPATAVNIIDSEGGLEKWRENGRKKRSQPSARATL